MKKMLLFIVFTVQIFGQMDFSQFNKIGFGDLYLLSVIRGDTNYTNGNIDYPLLKQMGLTHLATFADNIPISNHQQGLKILDRNFERSKYVLDTNFNAFVYSFAMGNKDMVPYEIGGSPIVQPIVLNKDNNWGFGKDIGSENAFFSHWQTSDSCIGDQDYPDISNYNVRVSFADTSDPMHREGSLVHLNMHPDHQPFSKIKRAGIEIQFKYRAGIRVRINKKDTLNDNDSVLSVRIQEVLVPAKSEELNYSPRSTKNIELYTVAETLDTTIYILKSQFPDSNYHDIFTPYFVKRNGYNHSLIMRVKWLRKCNVYIDKAYVFNQFYDSLFVQSPTIIAQKESLITSSFIPNRTDPNYAHAYFDEPMPLQYYGQQRVSRLWETATIHQKYVKGADMWFDNTNLELINYLHTPQKPKYILSDHYPLDVNAAYTSTGQNSLQTRFQTLVGYSKNQWGGLVINFGLRQMINWAHNFNSDHSVVNEHIPFYHTIQCQGEVYRDESGNATLNLRRPTYNEIMAQGWLALCYGAKGLMYYNVETQTPSSDPLDKGYYVYGLFDSGGYGTNSHGDSLYSPAPDSQRPNIRYYAVKELNNQIDAISSTLMDLTWYQGDSRYDSIPLTGTYITSVTAHTGNPPNFDPTSETFVELGLFKKTTSFSDNCLDYFMVVNRRCLESEGRFIRVKINKSGLGFKNWKVTDIGRDTSYVILDTGSVNIYFEPGRGKLFRLEPVMIAGGTLAYNETVPQNTSFQVKGNVIVPSGKTLTINSGSNLTFIDSSKLTVSGTLIINGTSNNKAKLDFTSGVTWRGLFLNPGSSATIDYAEIEDAYWGINANACSLLIQNSEIKNCYFGIYLYYTSYDYYGTEIRNCNIHNTIYGIELNHSAPLITNCIISGSENGISCISSSNVHLGNDEEGGLNIIGDGDLGVYSYASDPYLGIYDEKTEIGGYNSIVGAGYNVEAEMDSYVYAHLNWWGSSTPDPSEFKEDGGVIDYDYYLDYSPFGESQTPEEGGEEILVKGKTGQITLESMTTKAKYEKAVIHYLKNRKAEARVYCNSILDEEMENRLKYPALRLLVRCMDEDSVRTNVIGKINNTLLTTAQTDYNAYLEMTVADIVRSNYLTSLDGIMTKYRNTTYKPLILFRKFSYLYFEEENRDSARVIAEMMESQYPDHELTKSAKMMFGVTTLKKETEETSIIPKEYKLYQNYPNPFNPVTTIKYELPANSKVTLTIYDILGKEVTKLVDKEQESGKYQITFDAKRYASGVYICRIVTGDFVKTIKMSLVK